MESVTFDTIIVRTGDLGFFQKRLLIYITLVIMVTSYMTYLPMFILTSPKHRCALDGLANDTYLVQSPDHLELVNASIPLDSDGQWSSCYLLTPISSNGTRNQSAGYEDSGQKQYQETQCDRWVYDRHYFDTSIIENLNLVCDLQGIRTYANMAMMLGMLVAPPFQGMLSDMFGRKRCLGGLLFVMIANWFVNAFVFNVPSLLIARFVAGISTNSLYLSAFVLALEFVSPDRRRFHSVLFGFVWVVGGFALTGVAYFIRDSFTLMLTIAVPTVFYLGFIWLIPESPRWLMSKGRMDEARSILEKVASINKKPFPHAIFEKVAVTEFISKPETSHEISMVAMVDDESNQMTVSKPRDTETLKALLSNGRMFRRFLILMFNWVVNSLVYYALLFNISNLSGSVYLNFLLLNCVDLVSSAASYFVIEKFGRKLSYGGFLLIANVGCLVTLLPHFLADGEQSSTAIIILGLVGRAGVSTSFSILYLYTAELIPTTHRNKLMGVFSMCSKTGSIVAPYIADLGILIGGPMKEVLPLIVCGVSGFIASCVALMLPETVGTILPNNISEALECRRKSPKSSESFRKSDLKNLDN